MNMVKFCILFTSIPSMGCGLHTSLTMERAGSCRPWCWTDQDVPGHTTGGCYYSSPIGITIKKPTGRASSTPFWQEGEISAQKYHSWIVGFHSSFLWGLGVSLPVLPQQIDFSWRHASDFHMQCFVFLSINAETSKKKKFTIIKFYSIRLDKADY